MRIFVTGGTGFIGKHVVGKLLASKHDVLILSRKKSNSGNCIQGDLGKIKKWTSELKQFMPSKCVHLAWDGLPDYSYEVSKKNLLFGLNLYEFLTDIGCKGVFTAGSCWEYGLQNTKLMEDMPVFPMNAFTAAKNALNQLGSDLAKNIGMQFIWGRIFFAYGEGQRSTSLIPRLISYTRGGEAPTIRDPETELDFVYAQDVADAITRLIESETVNGTYNIGSGRLTKVRDVARIVGLPTQGKVGASSHSGYYADISKIKKEVGWKPKTTITEGIQKMV